MKRRVLVALALVVLCGRPAFAGQSSVTVRIDMRAAIAEGWFDPKSETVGLRGGTPPLSWGQTCKAADPDGDGIYETRVRFAIAAGPSAFVSYKFKVDGTNNPNDGWEGDGNRPLPLLARDSVVTRAFNATGPDFPATLTAPVRTYPAFASKYVAPRTVTVLLPPGYQTSAHRRYPVLYMHDGQNLFDARTAHGAEWRVDETAIRLMRGRAIEPIIIVGVASEPDHRIADYTPTAIQQTGGPPGATYGGSADAYGRFLVEELKPFVDKNFRTMPEAVHTGLGGSSLGGLVSMYLGLKYPGTFGRLLVVSPSVWWDRRFIVREIDGLGQKLPLRIWIDIGTSESPEAQPDARSLRDALVARGWKIGSDLDYVEVPGGTHDESAWAARFGRMLRFLYPRRN